MLPAASRLRRRIDFSVTVRGGRRASRGALVVHLASTATEQSTTRPEGNSPRAGFVVSKAVGNAVVRNRVKRRLRHLMRDRLGLLGPDDAVVVRALPAAAARSYTQLGLDLDEALAAARTRRHRGGER
ncbi:ribonuclease P protein component [Longispora fulva]|uniref:ribonuclease P protein component n=1 Tax=Longispora fulva TaxID=619741 RepID=UPI0018CBE785|nr:ribonuclease P protein component [Longispora fulva]GIG57998.1 ribonuclease P protein component [Longispora fulva]